MWSMYCDARNLLRASNENGDPLSVKNLFGGPYWEIKFCSVQMMESADLEIIWYTKGYLLKVCDEAIFFVVVCEVVSCKVL